MSAALRRLCSCLRLVGFALAIGTIARAQTAPVITSQPSSKTANIGAAVTFTVVASGATPTYQWLFNGAPIPGATISSYAIANVTDAQAGGYSVVVSAGAGSVTSNTVNLLVYAPYVVSTVAGQTGVAGAGDGTGTEATFYHPAAVASDLGGNLFIADTVNSVIRKMTPAGVVTLFAGQVGTTGSADGQGTAAQFNFPSGIAVDSSGNVYVADTFNSTVRKITSAGLVSTLAGVAPSAANPAPTNAGSANGAGTAARFKTPRGVAVDGAGNVYVADTQNNLIRKITPAGVVSTLAGSATANPALTDGNGAAARFNYPFGIASDQNGNLWVADTSNNVIRAVTPAGVVTTLAGLGGSAGSAGGTGSVARFSLPTAVAVDHSGDLFVADEANSTIREILPSGAVLTVAGLAGNTGSVDASGANARFYNAYGVAASPDGNIYIADTLNSAIRIGRAQPPADVALVILSQPASKTASPGAAVTFTVAASGTPAPAYQWYKTIAGGTPSPIAGATGSSLVLPAITAADGASYQVVVGNEVNTLASAAAVLTVLAAPAVPAGNQSQTLAAGSSVTLSANASGGNLSYQWQLNGVNLAGATGSSLTINPAGTYSAGIYTVKAANSLGSATGNIATLTVTSSARLLNLSAQAPASSGANVLSAGFVTSGGAKAVLVRGIGPGLAGFGVPGALADPQLFLTTAAGDPVAQSTAGWSADAGTADALAQVSGRVGAFTLAAGSLDQALLQPALAVGQYTAIVSGAAAANGQAMVELYDADSGTPAARLINLSARANSGTGTGILTGGFVISGTTAESVLLRGIGPTLATFGVAGVMAKPVLALYKPTVSTPIATNSAWGGSAAMAAIFTAVGAFPLPANSSDDAIVTTLAPGSYTVTVTGANGSTGVALVEIYEIAGR